MGQNFLIPHPNIPTADIGLPKLKEVTVKNNENFLALDRLVQEFNARFGDVGRQIASMAHDHPYAPEQHGHQLADIDGLVAALEAKAPLVHEHPQYLTEIPSHVHTEAEVDGLLADLAGKADAQHAHNMSDVSGLLDALGAKADNQRVDWIENNMAKISRNSGGSPDYTTNVKAIPPDETPEQMQARMIADIGTSSRAARADHVHRFSAMMGTPVDVEGFTDEIEDPIRDAPQPWSAGGLDGLKLRVLYGSETTGGSFHEIYEATMFVTRDGLVNKVEFSNTKGLFITA